jgi:hypothetical protein
MAFEIAGTKGLGRVAFAVVVLAVHGPAPARRSSRPSRLRAPAYSPSAANHGFRAASSLLMESTISD